jgi:hypothetical protein
MENNYDKPSGKKPASGPSELINEVIQSIESVDRKIEEFYEIHETELKVTRDNRADFRRK